MDSLGQYYWGQAWLGALIAADHQNRLGRGMSLAREGAIPHFELLQPTTVKASIQGSSGQAYQVSLSLKPFNEEQLSTLYQILSRKRLWQQQWQAGQWILPLVEALSSQGIKLTPTSMDEFDMSCSCPDAAKPCKHLAALFYVLASQIDEDPNLLFRLRGVEPASFISLNFGSPESQILQSEDLLQPFSRLPNWESNPLPFQKMDWSIESIDAAIQEMTTHWQLLLPSKPDFFAPEKADFKSLYLKYLAAAASFWKQRNEEAPAVNAGTFIDSPSPKAVSEWRLLIHENGRLAEFQVLNQNAELQRQISRESELLLYLEQNAESFPSLWTLLSTCYAAVQRSAVFPRLLALGDREYTLQWQMAEVSPDWAAQFQLFAQDPAWSSRVRILRKQPSAETLEEQLQRLGQAVADELEDIPSSAEVGPAFLYAQPRVEAAIAWISAMFLRPILLAGLGPVLESASDTDPYRLDHPVSRLFFAQRVIRLPGDMESPVTGGIEEWLSQLSLRHPEFRLLIELAPYGENKQGFWLRINALLDADSAPQTLPFSD